jgi:Predicted nucleic-acid-binding protein implicated in transcription termination
MGGLQTCQISGKEAESADMLRFVLSPDGELTPDLGQNCPAKAFG